MKAEIIEYFKNKLASPSILTKSIKTAPKKYIIYLNDYLKLNPEWEKLSYIISGWCHDYIPKRCLTCNKQMTYSKSKHHDYCSVQCGQINKLTRNKIEQTCLKKYGNIAPTQNKTVLKKRNKNNLKKYGVSHPIQLDVIKEKRVKTNIKKYGGSAPACSNIILDKIRNTCYNRYGTSYIPLITGWNEILKLEQYVKPKFNFNEYFGYNHLYQWICVKCGNSFLSSVNQNKNFKLLPLNCPRCLNCYPYLTGSSNMEKELIEFCKQYYPNLKTNDRTLIKPLELDIVIPELKLAIEFNGNYWHSNEFKNRNYHLNKTIECEKIGYRLIHIFEHEWLNKQEIVKSKLKSIFNVNQESIYARKCIIKEISVKDKNEFLNENHIQGEDKSNIKLGLYFNDVLVSVMTFCHSRFNKGYEWELSRYGSSKHVLGGAGKLLKYFEKTYKPKSLITYADRRFSKGNLYYKLGFTFSHFSSPNYFYVKCDAMLSRYQCQKHKLKDLLGESNFNKDLSETENMLNNGYFKIYDCGNYIFVKQ